MKMASHYTFTGTSLLRTEWSNAGLMLILSLLPSLRKKVLADLREGFLCDSLWGVALPVFKVSRGPSPSRLHGRQS